MVFYWLQHCLISQLLGMVCLAKWMKAPSTMSAPSFVIKIQKMPPLTSGSFVSLGECPVGNDMHAPDENKNSLGHGWRKGEGRQFTREVVGEASCSDD